MLDVLKKLKRHWKGGVPPGIQKALVEKKRLLDNFFAKVILTKLRLKVSSSFPGEAGRRLGGVLHRREPALHLSAPEHLRRAVPGHH